MLLDKIKVSLNFERFAVSFIDLYIYSVNLLVLVDSL